MEVRKTVTVVFADVTGSTALGERLDPEALRRVMSRHFEEARTTRSWKRSARPERQQPVARSPSAAAGGGNPSVPKTIS
jgi:hypothetical protein